MERSLLQYLIVGLKGLAMGAADVVPGVSGGTIAFISGIYEELIESINKINLGALKVLREEGVAAFWKHINGTFFVFLFGGIGISIFSLSKVVMYLLETQPILVWSFFFGLIVASVWLVGKSINKWGIGEIGIGLIGIFIAYWISSIQTVASVEAQWYIVLSGALAICAMILPGISGAFILILMGSYHTVYGAIKDLDVTIVGLFAIGCVIGLLSFARLLKWLFEKAKTITVALLTGFMIGSLYKVWPWKVKVGTEPLVTHSDGREDWMMANVLPGDFGGNSQLMTAIVCAVVGFAIIFTLERFGPKENK